MARDFISIVAPVFNEEDGIAEFVKQLYAVCYQISGYRFEVILVNDGSTDHTAQELELLKRHYPFRTITLSRNCGQQQAILVGLRNASGRAAIVLDADLQDPPEYLPILIRKWQEGADVVMCSRVEGSHNFFKNFTSRLFYRLLHLMDRMLPVDCGDFYLVSQDILRKIIRYRREKIYLRGLVARLGQRRVIISTERAPRTTGKSNYTFGKMLALASAGFSFTIKGYDK